MDDLFGRDEDQPGANSDANMPQNDDNGSPAKTSRGSKKVWNFEENPAT